MYFKRISDLHPLDAMTMTDVSGTPTSKYYDLDTLWIEVSQTFNISGDDWTPTSSSPAYTNDKAFDDISGVITRVGANNHETLSSTHAFLSRRCSVAEMFKNIDDLIVNNITATNITATNITATYANLDFITSYYIEGKSDKQLLLFNIPSGNITSTAQLSSSATVDPSAAVFAIDNTGVTAQNITVPGTATLTAAAAYWADLAEIYRSDRTYPPGTLVRFGGTEEVTIADNYEVNAVVTEKPAYLMNASLKETCDHPIGLVLTGRSKVRVIGPILKFDKLCLSQTPGVACKATFYKIIGIALETNQDPGEKLVEATLKLTF